MSMSEFVPSRIGHTNKMKHVLAWDRPASEQMTRATLAGLGKDRIHTNLFSSQEEVHPCQIKINTFKDGSQSTEKSAFCKNEVACE